MSKNTSPVIVGLDIGTTKVVAIAGRKNKFGKLEIVGFGKTESEGVDHGVVLNIEQCIRSIERALEKCRASNPNLEINDVYVGISGQHIKSLQARGDMVRPDAEATIKQEDIEKLIKDQYKTFIPAGDKIIDIIPQDFIIDNNSGITNPLGYNGVKIGANFHIVTGDKNAIKNIQRCVDATHLKTVDLVLQNLASAAAVINDQDLEAGVAIVDIGGGTTDMAVYRDGILKHTVVIPYAGYNITEDIRQGLGVLRAQAEKMKVQFGKAIADEANADEYISVPGLKGMPHKEISMKNLANIINARMHEIFDFVLYHLKQNGLDNKLNGGIIITGGGSQLKHIVQLCEYVTGLNARIGLPNEHLAGDAAYDVFANPMYATSIGLILKGFNDYENGKLSFSANGNLIHHIQQPEATTAPAPEPISKPIADTGDMTFNNTNDFIEEPELTEEPETTSKGVDKNNKRGAMLTKLFDSLKRNFISLFEDTDDMKM